MKTMILILALAFSNLAVASNDLITIQGVIHSATAGELDPFQLGDACLIEVELANKALAGLVTDYEQCAEYEEDLVQGRGITVVIEKKDRIKNRKLLNVLKRLSAATVFYNAEFGAIENGLADESSERTPVEFLIHLEKDEPRARHVFVSDHSISSSFSQYL